MWHEKAMLNMNEVILHCAMALFSIVYYFSDVENEIIRCTLNYDKYSSLLLKAVAVSELSMSFKRLKSTTLARQEC